MPGKKFSHMLKKLPAILRTPAYGKRTAWHVRLIQSADYGIIYYICVYPGSDIEAEVHYVAVLDHIFLAFDAELSCLFDSGLAAECHVVVIFDHFGAYESLFKIRMYDAGTLRRF